jgi:hypothetical protein
MTNQVVPITEGALVMTLASTAIRRVPVTAIAAVAITALVASGAQAVPPESKAERTSAAIERVAPDLQIRSVARDAGGAFAARGKLNVTIPSRASGKVNLATKDGPGLSIGLPDLAAAAPAAADDGTVVYDGSKADVAVQATADGARIQTVLEGPSSPTRYTYTLQDGVVPVANVDGSVSLTVKFGTDSTAEIATVAPAWAKDANGASVPTHYEVAAGALTQVVEPGADVSYPIVADPYIGINWLHSYVVMVFGYNEQAALVAGAGAVLFAGLCAASLGLLCGVTGVVMAMGVGYLGARGVCTGRTPYFVERVPFNPYNYGAYGYYCSSSSKG